MANEVENQTLALLREIRAEPRATKEELTSTKAKLTSLSKKIEAIAPKLDKMNIAIIGLKGRVRKVEEGIESIANILLKSPLLQD